MYTLNDQMLILLAVNVFNELMFFLKSKFFKGLLINNRVDKKGWVGVLKLDNFVQV